MGWLQRKGRTWPLEAATFAQTVTIARLAIGTDPMLDPTSLCDLIARWHLTRGFQYETATIHRAIAALTRDRSSKRSDRSRSTMRSDFARSSPSSGGRRS
jgi:hypothetical protein